MAASVAAGRGGGGAEREKQRRRKNNERRRLRGTRRRREEGGAAAAAAETGACDALPVSRHHGSSDPAASKETVLERVGFVVGGTRRKERERERERGTEEGAVREKRRGGSTTTAAATAISHFPQDFSPLPDVSNPMLWSSRPSVLRLDPSRLRKKKATDLVAIVFGKLLYRSPSKN